MAFTHKVHWRNANSVIHIVNIITKKTTAECYY